MYQTFCYEAEISVKDYLRNYVNVPMFVEACKDCPHYNQVWSCPTYSFDVMEYWKKFKTLRLYVKEIQFDEMLINEVQTEDELNIVLEEILPEVKQEFAKEMLNLERDNPGSICLSSGGSCQICREGCTKPQGSSCRHPELMRYSLEALGGNVCRTVEEVLGLPMEWPGTGRLPRNLKLVSGLLLI